MMQQVAPGKHQMAHYAFASGINLGVMLPGTISGFVSDWLGYEAFLLHLVCHHSGVPHCCTSYHLRMLPEETTITM